MKRRLLKEFLVIGLLLGLTTTAYANEQMTFADETEYNEVKENGSSDMEVTVHITSDFVVRIPKSIVDYDEEVSYIVGVKGSVKVGERVKVEPELAIELKLKDGDVVKSTVSATVEQEKQRWKHTEITRDAWSDTDGSITCGTLTAGDWTSTLHFNIRLMEPVKVTATDENGTDLEAKCYELEGTERDVLVESLVESGNVTDADEIAAVVEVTTNEFTGEALAAIDVSGMAQTGQSVALYHYDEENGTWDYIGIGLVDENGVARGVFNSFSPVAIKVLDAPGLYDENFILVKTWDELIADGTFTWSDRQISATGFTKVLNKCTNTEINGTVVISDEVGYIGYGAFYNCPNLDGVILGSGFRSTDNDSFTNCTDLKFLYSKEKDPDIMHSSFGWRSFQGCTSLQKVILPDYINQYANDVFCGCTSLTEVVLPEHVVNLDPYCFRDTPWNENLTYTDGMIILNGEFLFDARKTQGEVIIPDYIKDINNGAFRDNTALTSVTIPEGITDLDDTFIGCSNLIEVNLPSTIERLYGVFQNCTSLEEIYLPDKVDDICFAFYGCTSLKTVNIPANDIRISQAFIGCSSLEEITIPDTVTSIFRTFTNCSSLKRVVVPELVDEIRDTTFQGCTSLEYIEIQGPVTSLPSDAFMNCKALETVILPNTITTMNNSTFRHCENLREINLPTSLASIGNYVFQNCKNLESITIPSSVKTIGTQAFASCTKLANVEFEGSGLTSIGPNAFEYCYALTDIELPDSLTSLGNWAFIRSNVTNIKLSKNLASLGEGVFHTTKLVNVDLGDKLNKIPTNTFMDATSLETVIIPSTVTSFGGNIFCRCTNLKTITFKGTEEQWNAITKPNGWNGSMPEDVVITYNYTD